MIWRWWYWLRGWVEPLVCVEILPICFSISISSRQPVPGQDRDVLSDGPDLLGEQCSNIIGIFITIKIIQDRESVQSPPCEQSQVAVDWEPEDRDHRQSSGNAENIESDWEFIVYMGGLYGGGAGGLSVRFNMFRTCMHWWCWSNSAV